jgi:hypothetical protein
MDCGGQSNLWNSECLWTYQTQATYSTSIVWLDAQGKPAPESLTIADQCTQGIPDKSLYYKDATCSSSTPVLASDPSNQVVYGSLNEKGYCTDRCQGCKVIQTWTGMVCDTPSTFTQTVNFPPAPGTPTYKDAPSDKTLNECEAFPAILPQDALQYYDACGVLVATPVVNPGDTTRTGTVNVGGKCADPCNGCSVTRKWETTLCDKPLKHEQIITVPGATPDLTWKDEAPETRFPSPATRTCGDGPPATVDLDYTVSICDSVTDKDPVTPTDEPGLSGRNKCADFVFDRTWSVTSATSRSLTSRILQSRKLLRRLS